MARTLGTHSLAHPIVMESKAAGNEAVNEEQLKPAGFCVVLNRPKAKDLKVFDNYGEEPIQGVIVLLTRISNLDQIEVDNLDGEDFSKLGNLLERFVPRGQPNGDAASAT